jgi:long-chain fatty acid transport protein
MRTFSSSTCTIVLTFHLLRLVSAIVTTILLVAALRQPDCLAGGFMIPHQTARGLGLANAQTAGVQDASAVYYNPAALSEVDGNNLLISGSYINIVNSVENSGRNAVNKHDDNFLATIFANYHIPESDFTLGLGTYTPFGLATTYDRDFTRFAAERSELRTIYVTPAVSWHPSKYFSAGAGASFVHASGLFSRALCFDPITGCTAPIGLEGRLRLTDTTNTFAYNLGILIKPTAALKVGFSYRSRADLRFNDADVKLGGPFSIAQTKANVRPLPLPPVTNIGLYWQINPSWGAELVYEHARWKEFNRFAAMFAPVPTFAGVPVSGFRLPEEWKNTSVLRLGSFYRLNQVWEVRGGITLDETPIPGRRLNPAIPGADILTLNAGVGYKWDKVSIEFGYMAVFYKNRRVTNGELEGLPATGIPFRGAGFPSGKDKYETFHNFLSFSLNYRL